MPLRWHVDLPGPVAYSKPIRRRGKKPGCLTAIVVWFIVKPLELMVRGLAALFTGLRRPHNLPAFPPPVGWHDTAYGPLYWDGRHWLYPDGGVAF